MVDEFSEMEGKRVWALSISWDYARDFVKI